MAAIAVPQAEADEPLRGVGFELQLELRCGHRRPFPESDQTSKAF
jgi:hypothetical protein